MIFLLSIFTCFAARACHVFPLTFIANRYRKERVPINMQIPIWWAGLRGAVAVALSFSFPLGRDDDGNMPYVVTSTLGIVLTTTIICGGTTVQVLDACGMNAPRVSLAEQDATGGSGPESERRRPRGGPRARRRHHARQRRRAVQQGRRTLPSSFDRTFMRKWYDPRNAHTSHPAGAGLCTGRPAARGRSPRYNEGRRRTRGLSIHQQLPVASAAVLRARVTGSGVSNIKSSMLCGGPETVEGRRSARHRRCEGGVCDPQSKDGSYLAPSCALWSPHSRSEEHEPAVPPMGSAAPQDELEAVRDDLGAEDNCAVPVTARMTVVPDVMIGRIARGCCLTRSAGAELAVVCCAGLLRRCAVVWLLLSVPCVQSLPRTAVGGEKLPMTLTHTTQPSLPCPLRPPTHTAVRHGGNLPRESNMKAPASSALGTDLGRCAASPSAHRSGCSCRPGGALLGLLSAAPWRMRWSL